MTTNLVEYKISSEIKVWQNTMVLVRVAVFCLVFKKKLLFSTVFASVKLEVSVVVLSA